MNNSVLSAELVDSISQALTDEILAIGRYAAIAKGIRDPGLRTLFYSIVGDKYGHARALALFLTLNGHGARAQITQVEEAGEALKSARE
ncbi:MAG TPA: hypothetical protein DG577_08810 [Firmicutes bacterium]|jgi:rubrerythrin|nr:hypothetical protein [Bacillota bacterium]HCX79501.1 hypothetical protein [Bacillota bacterium]